MRSSHGEIEVFLCPDDSTVKNQTTTTSSQLQQSASVLSKSKNPSQLPSELLVTQEQQTHRIEPRMKIKTEYPCAIKREIETISAASGMRDAMLGETDDFEPMGGGKYQLQTEDQMSSGKLNLLLFIKLIDELFQIVCNLFTERSMYHLPCGALSVTCVVL